MFLIYLPSDILSWIFNHVDGYSIGRIWFCGSHLLNWKLSKGGGLTSFFLETETCFPIAWPSLVSKFDQLERFTFNCIGFIAQVVLKLDDLPRKLRYLSLSSKHDLYYLEKALSENSSIFSDLQSLIIDGSGARFAFDISFVSNLPKLTFLSINSDICYGWTLDVDFVPQTLTYLNISAFDVIAQTGKRFPESLTEIQITICLLSNIFALLPDSLISLSILYEDEIPKANNMDWRSLPSGLTSLETHAIGFNSEHAKLLPSGLKSLRIGHIPQSNEQSSIEILKCLPKTLTKAHGIFFPDLITTDVAKAIPSGCKEVNGNIKLDDVPFLPYGIQNIQLENEVIQIINITSMPSNLTFLSCSSIPHDLMVLLPSTLTFLAIGNGYLTLENAKFLPPRLTSLTSSHGQAFESVECWKYLPPTLTLLDVIPLGLSKLDQIKCIETFSSSKTSSAYLPSILRQLTIGPLNIHDAEWFSCLPTYLRSVIILCVKMPQNAFSAMGSLKFLRSLQIRCQTMELTLSHYVLTLPRSLDDFSWLYEKEDQRDEEHPNWKKLNDLKDSHLMNLPPGLTSISLPRNDGIIGTCAEFMPQYLSSLQIGFRHTMPLWWNEVKERRANAYNSHSPTKRS
jgi:hypothetical protein